MPLGFIPRHANPHREIPQLAKPVFGVTNQANFCTEPKENGVLTMSGRRHLVGLTSELEPSAKLHLAGAVKGTRGDGWTPV
jgi:hypothetical protein